METSLDALKSSTISEEDSRLVDSILNELNTNKEPPHLTNPPQKPSMNTQPMNQSMQQPMQQSMQQPMQQPMQQATQQPMQQATQQPMQQPMGQASSEQIDKRRQNIPGNSRIPPPPNLTQEQFDNLPPEKKQMYLNHKQQYMAQNRPIIVGNSENISILDDLKNKSTLLLLIFILLVMIQSSPMNYILAVSPETFFNETGECNLSGVVIKSFIICILYYVVTRFLF